MQRWLVGFNHPHNWWQLGIILASLLIAWLLSRGILRLAGAHIAVDQGRLKKFTLRSIERIVFPISALLVIILASSVFRTLNMPSNLFNLASLLLLSFAGIRMLVYILRKGFAPTPMLKAWENIISTCVWVIVALYLMGVLPVVLTTLDGLAFKLGKVQLLDPNNATAEVTWYIDIRNRRTQELSSYTQTYQVRFAKELGKWRIRSLEEVEQ